MTPKANGWICAAITLILFGILLFGGAMMALQWDFSKLSIVQYKTTEHTVEDAFRGIRIETDTADIDFVPTDSGIASVVCRETEKAFHTVSVQNGTLTVSVTDTRKWYEHIGINWGSPKITVYLPKMEYGALFIKESTGDIAIPGDFSFESMDLTTATGSIAVRASAVGDMTINVTTGKTVLSALRCENLYTTGSTGDITLTDVIAAGRMSIERTTGDVILIASDAGEIFIKVDTGDVTGTLLSDKIFEAHTDTGRIRIPKSVSGGRCEITTDTGDIKIEIE